MIVFRQSWMEFRFYSTELCLLAKQKNHPVCVVTPHSPKYPDNEAYPILRYNSIPILGRKPYRFGLPKMDMSFKTELKQFSFGLVHAHCPF